MAFPSSWFWTSSCQKCEPTNFCSFEPPTSWYLVKAILGNRYIRKHVCGLNASKRFPALHWVINLLESSQNNSFSSFRMFWVKSNTKDKEIRLRILLVGSEVLSFRKESFQEVRTNLSSVGSLTGTGPSDSESLWFSDMGSSVGHCSYLFLVWQNVLIMQHSFR